MRAESTDTGGSTQVVLLPTLVARGLSWLRGAKNRTGSQLRRSHDLLDVHPPAVQDHHLPGALGTPDTVVLVAGGAGHCDRHDTPERFQQAVLVVAERR